MPNVKYVGLFKCYFGETFKRRNVKTKVVFICIPDDHCLTSISNR